MTNSVLGYAWTLEYHLSVSMTFRNKYLKYCTDNNLKVVLLAWKMKTTEALLLANHMYHSTVKGVWLILNQLKKLKVNKLEKKISQNQSNYIV